MLEIVRHCAGKSFAKCSRRSSSSRVHSVLRMEGSSHSCHRALHCLAVFLGIREAQRGHWFKPYLLTAALSTSSSLFFHTPPFNITRISP